MSHLLSLSKRAAQDEEPEGEALKTALLESLCSIYSVKIHGLHKDFDSYTDTDICGLLFVQQHFYMSVIFMDVCYVYVYAYTYIYVCNYIYVYICI